MPDTQIYSFFLDNGPGIPGTFLFRQKFIVSQRPQLGQIVIKEFTFEEFKVIRDEIPLNLQVFNRILENGDFRITEDSDFRITEEGQETEPDPASTTHNYFITPANDPNRISSWTSNKFEEDQTLQQLFR